MPRRLRGRPFLSFSMVPVAVRRGAQLEHASWIVAGLAVLADWIGSSQTWFEYTKQGPDLAAYWQTALGRAHTAVSLSGVIPAAVAAPLPYTALMDADAWVSTGMQSWAETVTPNLGLYIIEDATGSGKTEAALMVCAPAHVCRSRERALYSSADDGNVRSDV